MAIPLITEGIIIFGVIVSSFIIMRIFSYHRKERYLKNFAEYVSVLEYNMQRAYDIIHKDQILIYSLEGLKIEDKDFDAVSENFVRLVIKLLGPMLYEEFIFLFGNEDTLMFNLIEFFNSKYEDDEVRRGTLDNLYEEGASEEPK